MSSKTGADTRWSLTDRLTVLFAGATSALIALYAVWSAYFVFDSMRGDLDDFLEHESQELALVLSRSDGSDAQALLATEDIAEVTSEPPCAFRVRRADGSIVAEAGLAALLEAIETPIDPEASTRERFWSDGQMTATLDESRFGFAVEVFVDTRSSLTELQRYLLSALVVFLIAVVLAGLMGRWVAARGLSGLREVVARAGDVEFLSGGARLRLDKAPAEVAAVGLALNQMVERIDSGLDSMRTFTAGLAHELRAPLQNLVGEIEVVLLSHREPDEYRTVMKSNLDELHELSDAVDNMIAFCRTAAPQPQVTQVQREAFDLADEVELRLRREQRSGERKGVKVEISKTGNTELVADREACLRVVRNLVGNAVHWSSSGGKVTVQLTGRGDRIVVQVSDEGPGVPSELGERVFEPFVSGRQREGERAGYGLGLAICRSAVDQQGGELAFENLPDRGTMFTASFPRRAPAA